jgi:hypothetical protein
MALRIVALLFAGVLFAQTPRTWRYYPQYTEDTATGRTVSGLVFYWEGSPAPTAEITITYSRNGQAVTETQTLDTDRIHGERLVFRVLLDEKQRHEIPCVKIQTGKYVSHVDRARSGVSYGI